MLGMLIVTWKTLFGLFLRILIGNLEADIRWGNIEDPDCHPGRHLVG